MKSIITLASPFAIIAASTSQLPKVAQRVRIAQLQILKEMQTKNWGALACKLKSFLNSSAILNNSMALNSSWDSSS